MTFSESGSQADRSLRGQRGFVKRDIRIFKRERWNWRKLRSMGSLGALGFLMLFYYQNCAPASQTRSLAGSADEASIVTTIDNVNATTGVAFTQAKVQLLASAAPTVIQGACDAKQSGAVLGWKVRNAAGDEMERGYSVCDQGKFQVEMAPADELQCDQSYELTARLNAGAQGRVELKRDCGERIITQLPPVSVQ